MNSLNDDVKKSKRNRRMKLFTKPYHRNKESSFTRRLWYDTVSTTN